MNVTFDPMNEAERQRVLSIIAICAGEEQRAIHPAPVPDYAEADKPKRTRRTKEQIAADEAAAAAKPEVPAAPVTTPAAEAQDQNAKVAAEVKAEVAAKLAAQQEAPKADPAPAPEAPAAQSLFTADELRDALIKLAQAKGKDKAREVLKTVAGAENVSGCPEDKRAAVIKACQEALA